MIIRREKKEDFKSIYEINKQAFKQKNESELIERIRGSENFIPELSLVAEKNGRIVGHIKVGYATVEATHNWYLDGG